MNKRNRSYFWYMGAFLFSVILILADGPLYLQVRRYASRTYQAYWPIVYSVGVFSLLTLLLLCKNHANIAMRSNRILFNSICVIVSFVIGGLLFMAVAYWQLLELFGLNGLILSGMLTVSCIADLVYSCCRKEK